MATSPRNPWLAGLASLFVPGLGQVYNGQGRKGAALMAATVLFPVVAIALFAVPAFSLAAVPLVAVGGIALWAYAIFDGARTARRRGPEYTLQRSNRVLVYVGIVIAFAIAKGMEESYLRAHVLQAFRIPSESMLPTLQVGDYVYVDKSDAARLPTRGAVVAYRPSEKPGAIYMKRVVALEGDTVEVRGKALALNGRAVAESYVIHIDPLTHPAGYDARDNFGPFAVTGDSYFVLGDNRDNSNDSRFSGPVEASNIVGTARWIYWSWDGNRQRVRWERIGRRV